MAASLHITSFSFFLYLLPFSFKFIADTITTTTTTTTNNNNNKQQQRAPWQLWVRAFRCLQDGKDLPRSCARVPTLARSRTTGYVVFLSFFLSFFVKHRAREEWQRRSKKRRDPERKREDTHSPANEQTGPRGILFPSRARCAPLHHASRSRGPPISRGNRAHSVRSRKVRWASEASARRSQRRPPLQGTARDAHWRARWLWRRRRRRREER